MITFEELKTLREVARNTKDLNDRFKISNDFCIIYWSGFNFIYVDKSAPKNSPLAKGVKIPRSEVIGFSLSYNEHTCSLINDYSYSINDGKIYGGLNNGL